MSRYTWLETAEDVQWARDVHGLDARARAALLVGNEDAPVALEWYTKPFPTIDDRPVRQILDDDAWRLFQAC
jgi:hypothetical protein